MGKKKQTDELTTKLHSEFTVSTEVDIKHRVFSLLTLTGVKDNNKITKYLELYELTIKDVDKWKGEFIKLF